MMGDQPTIALIVLAVIAIAGTLVFFAAPWFLLVVGIKERSPITIVAPIVGILAAIPTGIWIASHTEEGALQSYIVASSIFTVLVGYVVARVIERKERPQLRTEATVAPSYRPAPQTNATKAGVLFNEWATKSSGFRRNNPFPEWVDRRIT